MQLDDGTRDEAPASTALASGRARGEVARAGDVRVRAGRGLITGLALGLAGIAVKLILNEVVSEDTGYIVLMAATVLAAWFGGSIGGVTATATAVVLDAVLINGLDPDASRGDLVRQVLFLVVGTGTALVIASRRASRDRLVDALADVGALAEQVESRDARLEFMLAASRTGFWEWDIVNGGLSWSEEIFRQHGLDARRQAPDFNAYVDTIHPDDRATFQDAISAAVEEDVPLDLEFRIVWPDGSIHWTHGAGRVYRDESGRPIRMMGTGQDVTERRRATEERDRLLTEERQAREFREAFVDVISHELRTPITTILGLAQILARPGRSEDAEAKSVLLEDVRAEAERLHRLTEDLLVLSRVERGRLEAEAEPLEARRLIDRIVATEAPRLPSITIDTRLDVDLPIVAGEATYVEQILRNLLANAAKYTPFGSHVVVAAKREGATVAVRVLDDGPGIPDGSIERIFELFYRDPTSARTVAGSGIGLFVCASLAEAMGGRIWAARRPEGGSEFGFSLRVLEPDADDLHEVAGDTTIVTSWADVAVPAAGSATAVSPGADSPG